jgi:hypothetical protein
MTHEAFYSTAAQVIPVMWIVLVFQLKFFGDKAERDGVARVEPEESHKQTPTWTLIFIVLVGFLLWTAELDALYALLDDADSDFTRQWIILALVGGGSLFFWTPIAPWSEALLERVGWLERRRQRWFRWLKSRRTRD